MFCPQCSAANSLEQHFCRQCGLSLPSVRLALEGRVDEALRKFKKSRNAIDWGLIIFLIGIVNAAVNAYFAAWQSAGFSAASGLLIGLSLMIAGSVHARRAEKILRTTTETDKPSLDKSQQEKPALPSATNALDSSLSTRNSITEGSTLKLDARKRHR